MKPKVTGAPEYIAVAVNWRTISAPLLASSRGIELPFKLRRASRSRPGDVFLVLGELDGAGEVRFEDLAEVTWASAAVFDADLCYRPVRWA